jgi:hypothetical protein
MISKYNVHIVVVLLQIPVDIESKEYRFILKSDIYLIKDKTFLNFK